MKTSLLILSYLFFTSLSFGQNKELLPFKHNDLRLGLKLPHVNFLSVSPNGSFRETKAGFNGYGIGVEYSYSERKFLESSLSFVLTFEWIIPAPIDREYNKVISSSYVSITDNFIHNRFTFGYGLNYSVNNWSEWYRNMDTINLPTTASKYLSNRSYGVTLNTYYRLGRSLHIGIIYRPSLLKVNNKIEFIPEHLISLEVNWRILLNRRRNKVEMSEEE